jgi:hypothetical protein
VVDKFLNWQVGLRPRLVLQRAPNDHLVASAMPAVRRAHAIEAPLLVRGTGGGGCVSFRCMLHAGADLPAAVVTQINSDVDTMRHFSRMAKVFRAWGFYRDALMVEASQTGHPVARHLLMHYQVRVGSVTGGL